jgi:hypothetical protein
MMRHSPGDPESQLFEEGQQVIIRPIAPSLALDVRSGSLASAAVINSSNWFSVVWRSLETRE